MKWNRYKCCVIVLFLASPRNAPVPKQHILGRVDVKKERKMWIHTKNKIGRYRPSMCPRPKKIRSRPSNWTWTQKKIEHWPHSPILHNKKMYMIDSDAHFCSPGPITSDSFSNLNWISNLWCVDLRTKDCSASRFDFQSSVRDTKDHERSFKKHIKQNRWTWNAIYINAVSLFYFGRARYVCILCIMKFLYTYIMYREIFTCTIYL